jgi:hypothetical protein
MNSGFFAVLASLAARTVGRHLPHRKTQFESFWDEYVAPLLAVCVLLGIIFVVGFVIYAEARSNYKSHQPMPITPEQNTDVRSYINAVPSGESLEHALSTLDETAKKKISRNSDGVSERLADDAVLATSGPAVRCLIISNPEGMEVAVSGNSNEQVPLGRTPLFISIPASDRGILRSIFLVGTDRKELIDTEGKDNIVRF